MSAVPTSNSGDQPGLEGLIPVNEYRLRLLQEGSDGLAAACETWRIERILEALAALDPADAVDVLDRLPEATQIVATESLDARLMWRLTNARLYPPGTIGRIMSSPKVAVRPDSSVGEAIDKLRSLGATARPGCVWICGEGGRLLGTTPLQALLVADPATPMSQLKAVGVPVFRDTTLIRSIEIARVELAQPAYPVVDARGRLVGMVRDDQILRGLVLELTGRPGELIGVRSQERLSTSARRTLRGRLPWLTINLLTCFAPAAVIAAFEGQISDHVLIAAFLPVLIGQSINAGGQSLSVMMRALSIGDVSVEQLWRSLGKEARVGLVSGTVAGTLAGLAMWALAAVQHVEEPTRLGVAVCVSMIGACVVGGLSGSFVPWVARRMRIDPGLCSHIALTTVTDTLSVLFLLAMVAALL